MCYANIHTILFHYVYIYICEYIQMGIKKYMDAAFNPYDVQNPDKKLQDSVAQCSNTTATAASQTTWHR
jgi:hypothetical protein